MATFLPFNFNPKDIEPYNEGDGLQTIAAGHYALVQVTCKIDGYFQIDSETVIDRSITTVDVEAFGGGTTLHTVSANSIFYGQGYTVGGAPSSTTIDVGGVTALYSASSTEPMSGPITAADGQVIAHTRSGVNAVESALSGYEMKLGPEFATFWVPTGTTLQGFGNCTFTVSRYEIA